MRPLGVNFAQPGQWAISINRLGREKNSVFGYIARAQRELFRLFSKHGAQNGPPPPCYAYCRSRGGCRPSATAEGCVRLIAQIEQFKLAKLGLLPLGSSPEFLSISRLSSHSSSFAARSLASESFIGSAYTTSSASATRLRHSSSASIFAAGLLFLPQPGKLELAHHQLELARTPTRPRAHIGRRPSCGATWAAVLQNHAKMHGFWPREVRVR